MAQRLSGRLIDSSTDSEEVLRLLGGDLRKSHWEQFGPFECQ